jgi:CheY-like chemotaxis protein
MAYLGSLVGSIAHDFKNMLQAIIGYTEIATDYDHDPSRQRSSLEEITECIREGAELVNNLLAFGRRSPVFPASVNLNDELVTLSKLIRLTLSNITQIEMDLMDEPARIEVDRSLLKHLIMNLAINSSEAMPNGGSLKISTSKISLDEDFCRLRLGTKPGSYVMLTVTDTGRGMDSHTLHRIFLPYFSTKPEGNSKGVGMGLSVVRGVAELHGGFVTCDSEIGNGSSFKVYFPDVEALASTSELTTPLSRSIAKNTILLVEDSVPVSELGEKFLKKAGYNTIVANNGKRAINIFRKKKADIGLVILDLIMPGMNGKDTLMELLKIDSKVKAIAMTGCEPEHELARDIRPYVKEFLSKPCKMSDLVKTVRSLLPIQDPVGLQT